MGRCNFMRILSGFERLLLLGGLLLVAAYAAAASIALFTPLRHFEISG